MFEVLEDEFDSPDIYRAYLFAKKAHEGQVRKFTGEAYITHPVAVARMLYLVPHTDSMMIAALLHDVVEDTEVTLEEVKKEFGEEVANYVYFLTDISKGSKAPRAVRKDLDKLHISGAPAEVKSIKLADITHNAEAIASANKSFATMYLVEKESVLKVLTEGDETLYAKAMLAVSDAKAFFESA